MEKTTAIEALAALAQETRLDIFRALVEYQPDGLPAGKIGELLKLPGATLSFHLNELKHAGLIQSTRDGRSLIHTANTEAVDNLADFLREDCCSKSVGPAASNSTSFSNKG